MPLKDVELHCSDLKNQRKQKQKTIYFIFTCKVVFLFIFVNAKIESQGIEVGTKTFTC